MGNEQAFFDRCQEVFQVACKMPCPLIVHHYDCDGITSGSIVASWFERNGKPYKMKAVRKVDDELITILHPEKNIIFVDLGGGSPAVDDLNGDVVIVDHHQPLCKKTFQANPHLFGFDGGSELSASGTAYFTFKVRSDLGVTGAVGDIQSPLKSLNRKMLSEGVSKGEISISTDILLFGRNCRPLLQFLLYADEPYLPGLTGNEEGCLNFLSELGISQKTGENWNTYSGLPEEKKRKLVSALAELLSLRYSPESASRLTGEVYTLLSNPPGTEMADASEFSTLLNACGRNNRAELGVGVCLGQHGAYESARTLLAEHRKNLREGIAFASRNIQDMGKFIMIDARGRIPDSIIGVVAGMVHAGTRKKVVLALSLEESGKIKLSTRGTRALVEQGLNLGKILSECSAALGGAGGGHNIAAGATIPNEKLGDFLLEFSKRV